MDLADIAPKQDFTIQTQIIQEFITHKTVLVTGAGGSIGAELCKQLATCQPKKLILLDIAETPLHHIYLQTKEIVNVECVLGDIRNERLLAEIFTELKPEIVFHTAAYKHVHITEKNPLEALKVNFFGTVNLCEAAIKYQTKDFILISSDKAVNPTSVMGATKRLAEQYVMECNKRKAGTNFKIVRFGNVFNSNGSVIETFTKQLQNQQPITLTHSDVERYFISITAACNLILQTAVLEDEGVLFTFDMGKPIKIKELINLLAKHLQIQHSVIIKEIGLQEGEKLQEELYTKDAEVSGTSHEKIIRISEKKSPIDIQKKYHYLQVEMDKKLSTLEIKKTIHQAITEYQTL